MDTVIFHMTTWSCCHILGFPRERLSLINIVPSKNERSHFVIHYENSLIENKQEFLIALFIFKMSFFRIECQEGEKLSFPSEIHLFSWPFPIISINSLLPLGIQQSISLACFQSEMRQWPWKKTKTKTKKTHQKSHFLLCMEVKCWLPFRCQIWWNQIPVFRYSKPWGT